MTGGTLGNRKKIGVGMLAGVVATGASAALIWFARDRAEILLPICGALLVIAAGLSLAVAVAAREFRQQRERSREASDALRTSEERYRNFIAQSSEGIWRFEVDEPIPIEWPIDQQIDAMYRWGYMAECNDAMARMYGYSEAGALIGARLPDMLVKSDLRNTAYLRAFVEQGYRLDRAESIEVDRHGHQKVFLNSLVGVVERGHLIRAWGTQVDVTEQRKAAEELERAKEEAERANREKDRFLAVLSHELRTPLTPVLTTVQTLELDGKLPPETREALRVVRRNVELEARLIDDLLDLTRIARGKLALSKQTTDAHEKLRHVIQICDGERRGKQIELRLELLAQRQWVQCDPARLQQVFWNLLKNAVKFTNTGGTVTVRTANRDDGSLRIDVIDTGVGIEPAILGRIFDAFEQGDKQVTRAFGGLGLGLAISKALVDLHGGKISAYSDGPGTGATFTLELATVAPPAPAETMIDLPARPQLKLSILLVEDHPDTAMALSRLLRGFGWKVRVAETVADAVAAADAEQFDLLISDIGLPDGSGLDLMKQLRAKRPVRGICLSGFGMEEDVKSSRDAGFLEHLTKPVNVAQLRKAIDRAVTEADQTSALQGGALVGSSE
jgi:signal transduction histidine kinase/ActR/RegA family two-component response regulator